MKKLILVLSLTLMTVWCTACSEETQTVEWYKKHPEVLAKEFEKCKLKTPAELTIDKHCTVIRQAQDEAFHKQQRNAPIPTFK